MAGYVYVLRSSITGQHTIGSTGDLEGRISRFNASPQQQINPNSPWECVYVEVCDTLEAARGRERYLKSLEGVDEKIQILYTSRVNPDKD